MSDEIKICIDALLPNDLHEEARMRSIAENPANDLMLTKHTDNLEMAILWRKKWKNGRKLRVCFLDGTPDVQTKVEKYAHEWEKYANIKFEFGNNSNAEIRISFQQEGSWSYIGTDCLSIDKNQPTMNFGWLKSDTSDDEYSRVVLHEFGHALGCIHEHQSPDAKIPWDKEAVYREFMGPPNNWTKEAVDSNIFQRYNKTQTNFTKFDKNSIMLYAIPNELTLGDFEVGWNTTLSAKDKEFMGEQYPSTNKSFRESSDIGERAAELIHT